MSEYLEQQYQAKIGALMAAYAKGDHSTAREVERSLNHLETLIERALSNGR